MNSPRLNPTVPSAPRYRDTPLRRSPQACERRTDGTLLLRALDAPVDVPAKGFSDFVSKWARSVGTLTAFAQRDESGAWRSIDWSSLYQQMVCVAARLTMLRGGHPGPLMVLGANSIEQAVVTLAAEYVGMAVAPVSQNYALQPASRARLQEIFELVDPALVFVQSGELFGAAVQSLNVAASRVIAAQHAQPGQVSWDAVAHEPASQTEIGRVEAAHGAIGPGDTARIFFTSGSTGTPKGVPLSYEVLSRSSAQALYMHQWLPAQPMVMLDWLPWSHAFAGLGNMGRLLTLGGSYFIDDGRPLAGLFDKTVRNLREVSPTMYATVPAAWTQLVAALEADDELACSFFSRLQYVAYGGASLSRDVWERFQAAARRTCGEQIVFTSGFGSTETAASGVNYNRPEDDIGNIGVPNPGVEVKLVPLDGGDGRYEVRMRGRNVFKGYLKRDDLTQAAFDDEGFYCLGDAAVLADPELPEAGLRYAGRCVEDFKLATGTWVRAGSVRLTLIEQCSPLITDAVICGHDRDYVAALAWPNLSACRGLAPELANLTPERLVTHPVVVSALQQRLTGQRTAASSLAVARLMLMAEPPAVDAGEIADKGYINQAATRQRRSALVERLFLQQPGEAVARIA